MQAREARIRFPVSKLRILFFNHREMPAPDIKASTDSLGIIAGNRSLPLLFARQARSLGVKRLVAVAFEGETNPELIGLVDDIVWLKVGQLSKLISTFRERGVRQC